MMMAGIAQTKGARPVDCAGIAATQFDGGMQGMEPGPSDRARHVWIILPRLRPYAEALRQSSPDR